MTADVQNVAGELIWGLLLLFGERRFLERWMCRQLYVINDECSVPFCPPALWPIINAGLSGSTTG